MRMASAEEVERFEQSQMEVGEFIGMTFRTIAGESHGSGEGVIEAIGQLTLQVALLNLTVQALDGFAGETIAHTFACNTSWGSGEQA